MRDPDQPYRRSEAETFGCPHRYDAIYNRGADDTGDESKRGRVFHDCAWIYATRLASLNVSSDYEESQAAFAKGVEMGGCPDQLIHEVEQLFFRWAERFELDLQAFLVAEQLQRHGNRIFRPDLVYARPQELEITDLKTYYRGLTEAQALKELQLRWYLVEAKKVWPGFPRYRFTYDFVRLHYTVSLVFTPDEVDEFEPGVQASIDAIARAQRTGEYPAIPGSHCGLCRVVCPIVDDPARLPVRFTAPEHAQQGAGELLALGQRVKALRAALGSYCQEHGRIVVGGQEFSHYQETHRKWPAAEVIDFLRERGAAVETLRIGKSGLGEHGKKRAHLAVRDWLEKHEQTEQRWKFRTKKAGELGEDEPDA